MLVTRIFTRTGIHLRNFHYSAPSLVDEWAQPSQEISVSAGDQLANVADEMPSTNRADTPNIQQPQQTFESWKPNSFYSPLDFLRSRRINVTRYPAPPLVGPGAKESLYNDAFRQLDIDPIYEANNTTLLSSFTSVMGKILPRSRTKLSWRSQRKVARAIKRAKQKGVLAITSRYPVPKNST